MSDNQVKKISQRLKETRLHLGKTQKQLAEIIGYAQNTVSENESSSDKISKKGIALRYIEIFCERLHVNKDYIITGEGNMLLTEAQIDNKSNINAKPLHEVQYPIDATESPFLEMGNGLLTMFIPKVDEYAYGSFPGGFRDPEWVETLPKVAITVNKRHSGRYFAFDILGDSMENYETKEDAKKSIAEGSTVVGREIDRFHWKSRLHYHRWNAFVFVHKEYGVACKTILDQEVEDGVIHLGSFNPDKKRHKNFTWHLDDIAAIYNVVRIINEP